MTSNQDSASLVLRLKGIAFQDEAKAVTVRTDDLRAVLGLLSQETASAPDFDKAWAETRYQYGEDALDNVRIGWDLALAQLRSIAPRLDAPARIGATTFGKGVMWSTVVRRAQEEFRWGRQRPTLVLTEDERHWLDYAVCHMEDDSEPEDKTCAEVLRGLLARCVVPFDPTGFKARNPVLVTLPTESSSDVLRNALEHIAKETSGVSPTEAADRFQALAREALKKVAGDEALAREALKKVAGDEALAPEDDELVPVQLYRNACDSLEEWKTRAMNLEETLERLHAQHNAENGPTFMGEPVLPNIILKAVRVDEDVPASSLSAECYISEQHLRMLRDPDVGICVIKRVKSELANIPLFTMEEVRAALSAQPACEPTKTAVGVPYGYVLVPANVGESEAFMVLYEYQQPGRTRKDSYRIAIQNLSERAKEMLAAQTAPQAHDLYKTGDADAPDVIRDRNGEVVLGLCRRCGQGEAQLEETCPGIRDEAATVEAIPESDAELKRLVDYFNLPEVFKFFGSEGDLNHWTPVETAIKNLERFREARPDLRHHARVIELLRPFAAAYRRLRYFGANPTTSEHLYAGLTPAYELLNGVEGAPLTVDLLRIAAELVDEREAK